MPRVLNRCPFTTTVPTGLEMDADAFAAELGDRFAYGPYHQRTHPATTAIARLEAAADDNEFPHGRAKSILIADDHDCVTELLPTSVSMGGSSPPTTMPWRGRRAQRQHPVRRHAREQPVARHILVATVMECVERRRHHNA
jgi:hypothetical protein